MEIQVTEKKSPVGSILAIVAVALGLFVILFFANDIIQIVIDLVKYKSNLRAESEERIRNASRR